MSIEWVMLSKWCSLSPFLFPSIFSSINVFSSQLALCIRWPKYWSFSFSISLYSEYSRLISFRIDWFDLAVQGTLQASSLAQFRSINSLVLSLYGSTITSIYHYQHHWKWKWSRSVMSDSLQPHGLQPARLLCPWDFPGNNTGVGCHFLLQGIFPTQGSNPGLPHCRQMLLLFEPPGKGNANLNHN